jgi:hypothetical protein
MPRIVAYSAGLIGLLATALFLTAPAAAWSAHDLAHAAAPVDVNVVHHHDENGAIVVHQEPAGPADHDRDREGYTHMLSLSIGIAALLFDAPMRHPPRFTAVPAEPEAQVRPHSLADPPPQRPPSDA